MAEERTPPRCTWARPSRYGEKRIPNERASAGPPVAPRRNASGPHSCAARLAPHRFHYNMWCVYGPHAALDQIVVTRPRAVVSKRVQVPDPSGANDHTPAFLRSFPFDGGGSDPRAHNSLTCDSRHMLTNWHARSKLYVDEKGFVKMSARIARDGVWTIRYLA